MTGDISPEGLVFFGFSTNVLGNVGGALPERSVLVVEEPDVIRKRDMERLVAAYPAVSRVVPCEYQLPGAVERLLAEEPAVAAAAGIVPGVEYAVGPAAVAADALGLPGAGRSAAAALRDKARLRGVAAAAGLRNPAHAVVDSVAAAEAFFDRYGGPCVLKPTARQASLGVQIVWRLEEIAAGWDFTTRIEEGKAVPDRGVPSRVLVEQAVVGDEYSVEMIVAGGAPLFANVTAKRVGHGRFPVELGHLVPAPLDGAPAAALIDATTTLAAGAGYGSGVLHCEWIVAGGEPYLVECAGRLPGDEIPRLLTLAYDYPVVPAYLATLLGRPVPPPPRVAPRGAAITFLTAAPGRVTGVSGVDDAQRVPGVTAAVVTAKVGAVVHQVTSSWDRVGYVIASASTASEADAVCARAADLIHVATEPAGAIGEGVSA